MDFIPTADWQWVYDQNLGLLSLVSKDGSFPLAYKANMLRLNDSQSISFTIEDVTRYIELFESNKLRHFDEALRCKIILHIIAIDLFHKPIMPKSWLFSDVIHQQGDYKIGDIVTLTASGIPHQANYILLEHNNDFSLCMLLSELHQFKNNQLLTQCQLVKVTKNKLKPLMVEESEDWHSLQNVG